MQQFRLQYRVSSDSTRKRVGFILKDLQNGDLISTNINQAASLACRGLIENCGVKIDGTRLHIIQNSRRFKLQDIDEVKNSQLQIPIQTPAIQHEAIRKVYYIQHEDRIKEHGVTLFIEGLDQKEFKVKQTMKEIGQIHWSSQDFIIGYDIRHFTTACNLIKYLSFNIEIDNCILKYSQGNCWLEPKQEANVQKIVVGHLSADGKYLWDRRYEVQLRRFLDFYRLKYLKIDKRTGNVEVDTINNIVLS